MNFTNTSFLIYALIIILVFICANVFVNKRFFSWIKIYWSYERTFLSKISTIFYYLSFILFVLSLLDLRGPEERIKTSIPDQRTIIILDSSTSMLAEDIKPSRFSKAVQLARHFVKNSPGHQVAVVLFSDVQKRLIPFTDDVDLLDSRLAALDKNNSISGGSNIAQAIKEALGYFQTQKSDGEPAGNILVFTDAEESDGGFDLTLGSGVNLAVVGIGTAQGASIPIRWNDGSFRGYKTENNKNVITKLDEGYIKSLGKSVANYKYWIANSYSLPTTEIRDFFRAKFNQKNSQGDVRVRPVLGHLILIPAIIFFCLSVVLSRFKTFKMMGLALVFCLVGLGNVQADEENRDEAKKPELPMHILLDLNKLKEGKLNNLDTLKLAEEFLKAGDAKRAGLLYNDNIKSDSEVEAYFNMATALLADKKIAEAMKIGKLVFESDASDEMKNLLRNNFLLSQNGGDGEGKDDKEEKQDDKNEENKDDKNKENQEQDESQDPKENKEEGKDSKDSGESKEEQEPKDGDKSNNQSQKPKNEEKKEENKSDQPKDEPEDIKQPEREESRPQTIEEKEKAIEQQKKMIKTPAMIKQILNDDRELQKKMMDTSTNDNSKGKRDW